MQLRGKKYIIVLTLALVSSWCVPEKGYAGVLDCFRCCKRRPVRPQAEISEKNQSETSAPDEIQGVITPRRSERLKKRTEILQKQADSPTSPIKKRILKESDKLTIKIQKSVSSSNEEHPDNE
jgi:hypothetical protein